MRRLAPLTFLALLFLAGEAAAYIPPGPFLLRLLAERRRDARIVDLVAELESQRDGRPEVLDERLYMKQPERLRLAAANDDGLVYVEREGVRAEGQGVVLKRLPGHSTDLLARLLFAKGEDLDVMSTRMAMALEEQGVKLDVVSLSRLDGEPAYVIGAKPWEAEKPQVWLDKATLLPVRTVVYAEAPGKGARIDTRYLEYGSAATGNWLPRVIERSVDGQVAWHAELTKVDVNQKLPDSLFDIPK